MARWRTNHSVGAAPGTARPPFQDLIPEAIRERLDWRPARDGIAVQVDQRVELDEGQLSVAVQQGQAERAERCAPKGEGDRGLAGPAATGRDEVDVGPSPPARWARGARAARRLCPARPDDAPSTPRLRGRGAPARRRRPDAPCPGGAVRPTSVPRRVELRSRGRRATTGGLAASIHQGRRASSLTRGRSDERAPSALGRRRSRGEIVPEGCAMVAEHAPLREPGRHRARSAEPSDPAPPCPTVPTVPTVPTAPLPSHPLPRPHQHATNPSQAPPSPPPPRPHQHASSGESPANRRTTRRHRRVGGAREAGRVRPGELIPSELRPGDLRTGDLGAGRPQNGRRPPARRTGPGRRPSGPLKTRDRRGSGDAASTARQPLGKVRQVNGRGIAPR